VWGRNEWVGCRTERGGKEDGRRKGGGRSLYSQEVERGKVGIGMGDIKRRARTRRLRFPNPTLDAMRPLCGGLDMVNGGGNGGGSDVYAAR
jgi:hypothetical protein